MCGYVCCSEMWNSIPLDIRLFPSVAVFKSGMKKFLSQE